MFLLNFAVSFPHYFLQATGHLAEQLKTREWIVARITSIAERVVDQKVNESVRYISASVPLNRPSILILQFPQCSLRPRSIILTLDGSNILSFSRA